MAAAFHGTTGSDEVAVDVGGAAVVGGDVVVPATVVDVTVVDVVVGVVPAVQPTITPTMTTSNTPVRPVDVPMRWEARDTPSSSGSPPFEAGGALRRYDRPMRIGLINQLQGRPDANRPPPTWASIRARAAAAEATGFDMFVFEDALMYPDEGGTIGVWESTAIGAALAAVTDRIHLGQSVINSPYRSPALVAKIAETTAEISGGRYVLGIGAGNTPDADYEAFGFPTDHRYSRFAEAIEIIHTLLTTGRVDFDGEYHSARQAEMVLRGPRPAGPPINIAAGGPKMIRLAARYGDAWNWWSGGGTVDEITTALRPLIDMVDAACEEEGRDPADLGRTFDLYTVVPGGFLTDEAAEAGPVSGPPDQIAEFLSSVAALGFDEIRCDVWPKTTEAIEAMAPVVELVHGG